MEIIHEGWLLKSPPPKTLRRAKWRNRWFILRSGDLPGQYFLEYYTDPSRKKLKGTIDLDQCEQVDAGMTFAEWKSEFKFMFDIRTPKRVYYLCANSDEAMNKWVESVCQVCGLRAVGNDDVYDPMAQLSPNTPSTPHPNPHPSNFDLRRSVDMPHIDSPPPSASSTVSGPYIPISECVTGRKTPFSTRFPFEGELQSSTNNLENDSSQIPNEMAPPAPTSLPGQLGSQKISHLVVNETLRMNEDKTSTLSSREDNVFMENSYSKDSKILKADRSNSDSDQYTSFIAPPRPPKPAHLTEANYMNIDTIIKASTRRNSVSDKMRLNSTSTNATTSQGDLSICSAMATSPLSSSVGFAPPNTPQLIPEESPLSHSSGDSSVKLESSKNSNRGVSSGFFSYDVSNGFEKQSMDPRISPASIYSNVPSSGGHLYGAPAVDRGLKPKKNHEITVPLDITSPMSAGLAMGTPSVSTNAIPVQPSSAPPIVDRKLKPHKKISEPSTISSSIPFVLAPAPMARSKHSDQRKVRAAPSPTPLSHRNGLESDSDTSSQSSVRDSMCDDQVFFPVGSQDKHASSAIQYLDLDLDMAPHQHCQKQPIVSKATPNEASVVYKKVDFLKTEAFNKTRQIIEEGYRKGQ